MTVPETLPIGSDKIRNRIFAVGLAGFLGALTIGVDGHPIFQILAAESLGLGPRAIGLALGLGTLSIPVQIWAARIPLHRARHNIRLYLWSIGAMTLITAALVAFAEPGSWVAALALVVAILAEISVSVLMATAYQPVISYTLNPVQRAFIAGPGSALRGMIILASTVLIGAMDRTGRTIFLLVLALVTLAVAEAIKSLPPPPDDADRQSPEPSAGDADPKPKTDGQPEVMSLYIMTVGLALGRWPLLVTYASWKLWPTGNLGLLGGALIAGNIIASLLWRNPGRFVLLATQASTVVTVLCTLVLVAVDGPISTTAGVTLLFALAVTASVSRTITGTASMELVHRRIDTTTSVRVMTMLDAIGSTTAQLNLFVGGFLIAASTSGPTVLGMDLYQVWILVMVIVHLITTFRLKLLPGDVLPEERKPSSRDQSETDTHQA